MRTSRVHLFAAGAVVLLAAGCGRAGTGSAGSSTAPVVIPVGTGPTAIAVNQITHKAYVANYFSGDVTVIDTVTHATASIPIGGELEDVAVEAKSNKVYVTSFDVGRSSFSLAVIDGATRAVKPLGPCSPCGLVVNGANGKVYAAVGNDIMVIDAATQATSKIVMGKDAGVLGADPAAGKVYAANAAGLAVIDGSTSATATVRPGYRPGKLVVNPKTHRIYSATPQGVDVIDGTTYATLASVSMKRIDNLVVNPAANKVYVLDNGYPNPGTVTIIDGATNTTSTVPVGRGGLTMAVDQVANRVYVADTYSDDITVIDGANNATTTWRVSNGPRALAVDTSTGQVYVGNGGKAGRISNSPGAYTVTIFPGAGSPGVVPTVPRDTCMPSPPPPASSHQC